MGRTAVIGAFPPRTRTSTAQADVLERLRRLGLSHLFVECPSSALACESVPLRLNSRDDVSWLVGALEEDRRYSAHSLGPLYCIRARSREERARTGLVARAVRMVNIHREGGEHRWRVHGHYKRGQESLWVSWTVFKNEACLMYRDEGTAVWYIDEQVYAALGMAGLAKEWLASLL